MASIHKNRIFFWAVIVAALNPILSGLVIGLVMISERDLRREGIIVTGFSFIWGLILLMLLAKYKGVLPI